MLWTDRIFVSQNDLSLLDSEIPEIAKMQKIVLDGDNGSLKTFIGEAATEIRKRAVSFSDFLPTTSDVSYAHEAAVRYGLYPDAARQRFDLSQIVVSDEAGAWNNVKEWVVHWCIMMFYRNVFGRTVEDRFQKKLRHYRSEIQKRIDKNLTTLGIPIVQNPLPAPASYFLRNTGRWTSSNITTAVGTGTAGKYYIAVSFVDMTAGLYVSPASKGNAESALSEPMAKDLEDDQDFSVDVSTIVPVPGGYTNKSYATSVVYLSATHWNVYCGTDPDMMYLQNVSPIAIGTTSTTFSPTLSGNLADDGQIPYLFYRIRGRSQRG